MEKVTRHIVIVLFCVMLFALAVPAKETREFFPYPTDIKNEFCGVHINFQFCRCAFHNEFCDAVGMSSGQAHSHIHRQFALWIQGKMDAWGRQCVERGGIWNRPSYSCFFCEDDLVKAEGRCVPADAETVEQKYDLDSMEGLPTPTKAEFKGKVAFADGEVFVYSAIFRKWKGPVKGGHPLYGGDVLYSTGRGEGMVTFYSSSGQDTINVGPNTLLEVPDTSPVPDEPWYVTLKKGAVRIYDVLTKEAPRAPDVWNVRTPTVTTGTRGTDVIIAYDESTGVSSVALRDGEIDVTPVDRGAQTFALNPGQTITSDGDMVTQGTVSESEWNSLLATHGLTLEKAQTYDAPVPPVGEPIDPDAVDPVSIVYDGVFADSVEEIEARITRGGFSWWWIVLALAVAGAVYYFGWMRARRAS